MSKPSQTNRMLKQTGDGQGLRGFSDVSPTGGDTALFRNHVCP